MAISLLTNINSLVAQQNLEVNSNFQSQTIQRLSSGYRINQSSDDPAGLSIANTFRNESDQLAQGVQNTNEGISQLQIMDGGLSNISQILNRLKTLATQSASGSFTGDRATLNSEFQTIITEINRQAQSIGLNQNGTFAKNLTVFIGGGSGQASGPAAQVSVDLSKSACDSASLGLGGAVGTQVISSADISPASTTHTVAQILADSTNTTPVAGSTTFYLSGPGFAGANRIPLSVNLQGVSTLNGLVSAINSAIQFAANGSSAADATFKTAGISASAANGTSLEFSSAATPFQVEAGDVLANAFLGNFVLNNGAQTTAGVPIASSVSGVATAASGSVFTPAGVTVQFTGSSLDAPVALTLKSTDVTTDLAIADLTSQIAANAQLKAAGISVTGTPAAGSPLTFTNAAGEAFTVQCTGDTANALGLGSFVAGASNALDYTSISGNAYDPTKSFGSSHLEFSFNGAPSITIPNIDLSQGNAQAATTAPGASGAVTVNPADTLTFTVNGVPQTMTFAGGATSAADAMQQINTAALGVTASLDGSGHLLIASNLKGANSTLQITGGNAAAELGLDGIAHVGTSESGANLASLLNNDFAANPALQSAGLSATFNGGSLVIASSNSTYFRVNAGSSAPTADIGFGVAGVPFSASLTVPSASTSLADSSGDCTIAPLSFTPMPYGADAQTIEISVPNLYTNVPETATFTLQNNSTSRQGGDIDQTIAGINNQLQLSGIADLQSIVAVKQNVGGVEKINFLTTLPNFTVNVSAAANADGLNGGVATTRESVPIGSSQLVSITTQAGAEQAITALGTAVTNLSTTQAAVGKAENQLNYAMSLAQSETTNFAAADSQIRDADVAAEAANLSKSQILQQASIAIMAQANASTQAVLTLLRGS